MKTANQSAPSFFNSGGTLCGSMLKSRGIGGIAADDPGGGGSVATAIGFGGSCADVDVAVGVGGYGCGPATRKQERNNYTNKAVHHQIMDRNERGEGVRQRRFINLDRVRIRYRTRDALRALLPWPWGTRAGSWSTWPGRVWRRSAWRRRKLWSCLGGRGWRRARRCRRCAVRGRGRGSGRAEGNRLVMMMRRKMRRRRLCAHGRGEHVCGMATTDSIG